MSETLQLPSVSFGGSKKHALIIGVYNAKLSFTIMAPDKGGLEGGLNFAIEDVRELKLLMEGTITAQPGTQRTLVQRKWNQEASKFEASASIAAGKTDDGIYYIELQYVPRDGRDMVIRRFETMRRGSLEPSDRQFNPQASSEEGMKGLLYYFNDILPAALCVSAAPRKQYSK